MNVALFGLDADLTGANPRAMREAAAMMLECAGAALRVDNAGGTVELCQDEASALWLLVSSARDLMLASDQA